MPVNGFSTGRDISLDVIGPNGPLSLNLITGFSPKQDIIDIKIKGLDGRTRHVRIPDGWNGTFDLERQDSTLDDYFIQLEDDYYSGFNDQPLTITETIQESDGSVSQYKYLGVLLKMDDPGDWRGDATVKQRLSFVAERKVKV